jgi:hypothetical protein
MSKWINVKDKLPPKELDILICNDKNEVMFGIFSNDCYGDKFFTSNYEQYLLPGNITHWMYFPESPVEE